MRVLVVAVVLAASRLATAAPPQVPVTVYLDRTGLVLEDGTEVPQFGGGDRAWSAVVACVKRQYAPFRVDFVEQPPARGTYITAVVGGLASLRGLDDSTTNGVGPYSGELIPDAVVHVFSQVGTGERDVENLCAVTAHEVGHALGLDHEVYCGDIMSYYLDQCGARRFVDADAPCGEEAERACGSGEESQNSYRRLAAMVGLRHGRVAPQVDPQPAPERDPGPDPEVDPQGAEPAPAAEPSRGDEQPRHHHHRHRRWAYSPTAT